jgi:hypothetical protein
MKAVVLHEYGGPAAFWMQLPILSAVRLEQK